MTRYTKVLFAILSSVFLSSINFAQSSSVSDPQALSFAAQSITALTGGTLISDVTLAGTVSRTAGSDIQTGSVALYGKGQYESYLDLGLNDGHRIEIRNYSGTPQGEWIAADGTVNYFSQFNCLTDAVWFLPALSSLLSSTDSNQILSYVGLETLNGTSVQHIRSVWFGQSLSQMDFYLDATTLLPLQININTHPDDDSSTNIPMQFEFSNYQSTSGIEVPYHIQQVFNGNLLIDISLTSAAFNTGLSDSLFTIQ